MPTQIQTTYVPITNLNPALYNPRKWDKEATKKLRESLERFGFVDPILVNGAPDRMNIVIGGHFRLKVAKDMGMTEVPVVYLHIPDIEKEKELNLRLNRNTGTWDYDLLKAFDTNFLQDVGFDALDLQNVWGDLASIDDRLILKEGEVEPPEKPTIQDGEIYKLGDHLLMCADSTGPANAARLMREEKADMIYCDPPYNIKLDYANGVSTDGKYAGQVNDALPDGEYQEFIKKSVEVALSVAKPDAHIFYWCDQRYIWLVQRVYRHWKIENRRVCLWIKNNFNMTPQVAFNKAYEPCVYGTIGKPYLNPDVTNLHEIVNKDVDAGNRATSDIIDLFDIWLASRDAGQEYEHPTQKPLSLHEKPLKRCTKPGDVILDLFGGSGSTLLACEQMRRKARLIEKNPAFCHVIIKRFEEMTGLKAEKVTSN